MKYALRSACLFTVLFLPAVTSAQNESRWKMQKLNPFKKDKPAVSIPWQRSKLPQLGRLEKKPSMVERLTSGPKKFAGQTKKWLTPWKSDSKPGPVFRPENGTRTTLKSKKDRWKLFSWFQKKESELPAPMSVHEFIAQQRPGAFK